MVTLCCFAVPFQGNEMLRRSTLRGRFVWRCLEAHVKSVQWRNVRDGWRHKPGNYKACPNKAALAFVSSQALCVKLYLSIWCCFVTIYIFMYCINIHQSWWVSSSISDCGRHMVCVACLGEELEGAGCEHCEVRTLMLAFPRALVPLLPGHCGNLRLGVRKRLCQRG